MLWSWSSGRFNERTWHITGAKSVAIIGFIVGCATLNTGAKYFAMIMFSTGVYATNSIVAGWTSATCGQTPEKKSCSLAMMNAVANIAFIWTPVSRHDMLADSLFGRVSDRSTSLRADQVYSTSGQKAMHLAIHLQWPQVQLSPQL